MIESQKMKRISVVVGCVFLSGCVEFLEPDVMFNPERNSVIKKESFADPDRRPIQDQYGADSAVKKKVLESNVGLSFPVQTRKLKHHHSE